MHQLLVVEKPRIGAPAIAKGEKGDTTYCWCLGCCLLLVGEGRHDLVVLVVARGRLVGASCLRHNKGKGRRERERE